MMNPRGLVSAAFQSINQRAAPMNRIRTVLALSVALFLLVQPAVASQLLFDSTGGTMTLGSDFILSGASVTSPAGALSIDCPITSIGGSTVVTYACTGGSFNFQSTDGLTTVTGVFTTADLYLSASGGGRGGNIKYYYQFFGNFSGAQTVNGVSAAVIGETTVPIGPLRSQIGSGSATAGPGATGINSAYSPIYLTDYSNSQLVRSDDMFGTNKAVLGSTGTHINQFYGPHGVTADASSRIYVVDTFNCRIVRVDDITGANWTTLGGHCGAGTKQFSGAADIALDASGRIYVADAYNSRIVRFDDMSGTNWTTFGTVGSGTNQLSRAQGVAVDANGRIYIADTGNKRIVRIDDMAGTNWTVLTQSPVINGYIFLFGAPAHIAIDPVGRIVVGDGTNVIRVDDMNGTNWSGLGVGTSVAGLSLGTDGTTYVAGSISSGGKGVLLFDDVTTGAGFLGTNLVGDPGGIYALPVPTPVPAVTLSAASLVFGKQNTNTTSPPQSVTLTNFGGAPLSLAIALTGDFVSTNTCPTTLPGGSNCTISVSYAPTVTGAEAGMVTITDNAFTGTQSIALSGTGTAPVAGILPSSLSFQAQLVNTTSGGQFVALANTGTGPLTFTGPGISTSGDFAQTNNCGSAVLPLTSCQIMVTFTPTTTGSRTGNVYVTDNAGVQAVSLTGTGASAAPIVTVSPESLVFSTQKIKSKSGAQSVVLTNTGAAPVSVTSIGLSGDFANTGKCPAKLGAGGSCTLNVTFTPTAAGTRTGTLTYTLSSGVVTVALTGTGTATATGWLAISPDSIIFNNGYQVGDNPSQTFAITNTNGVPAGISKIGKSGSGTFTQTNDCGTSLGAYASCTVTVTFVPTVAGTFGGTITVTEGAGAAHKIPMSGVASTNGG